MRQEIKQLWIDALLSGEYKQTTGTLCDSRGHCCLGVLCEVAIKNGLNVNKTFNPFDESESALYDNEEALLPTTVMTWSGLDSNNGAYGEIINNVLSGKVRLFALSALNDSGTSFPEIAKVIQENF